MILNLVLAIAVVAAIAGALAKNWTAGALLASFIVSMLLCRLAVPFNIAVWMVIDVAVIAFVVRRGMLLTDKLICCLFAPVFVLYLWQPHWWAQAIAAIVALQMLLSFPGHWAKAAIRRARSTPFPRDPFGDLRSYA